MRKLIFAAAIALASASTHVGAARTRGMAELKVSIQQSLSAAVQVESLGVQNCENKCSNMFNRQAYSINTQLGEDTYEFSACRVGCDICNQVLIANETNFDTCFSVCKNTDWTKNIGRNGQPMPIIKGVIEPDKACIFGCIINTCQAVCQGGTPVNAPNSGTSAYFWGLGGPGCSIKTGLTRPGGFYSQNSQYNLWNNPSGAGGVSGCCSNALSLCQYVGNQNTQNYKNVLQQAQTQCVDVPGAGQTQASICSWRSQPSNCGTPLGS